jgi:hypothetical protein
VPDRPANARRKRRPPGILSRRLPVSELYNVGLRAGEYGTEQFQSAVMAHARAWQARTLDALWAYFGVAKDDPDGWRKLALMLAAERFAAFRPGDGPGRGRPPGIERLLSRALRPRRGRGRPADPRRLKQKKAIIRDVAIEYTALPRSERTQKRAVERFLAGYSAHSSSALRRRRFSRTDVAEVCRWISEAKAIDPQIAALFRR